MQDGRRETLNSARYLCRVDEIDDPGSKGFEGNTVHAPFFVVRRGGTVFGYRNRCPHYGAPLDWKPDAFLSFDRKSILCSMHGARFRIEDGVCIDGPCPGQALEKVELKISSGNIYAII